MSKTKKFEIRCTHEDCGKIFFSPLVLGTDTTFDTSELEGNMVDCPHCGRMTECSKENVRVLFEDGGFTGNKA